MHGRLLNDKNQSWPLFKRDKRNQDVSRALDYLLGGVKYRGRSVAERMVTLVQQKSDNEQGTPGAGLAAMAWSGDAIVEQAIIYQAQLAPAVE